jgi:HAD superfamily hydrolase (TIGR01509 family)
MFGTPSSLQPVVARAIIFDLDGTITLPILDFDVIRREIGLPTHPRTPVLEALGQMTPEARAAAEAILLRHEEAAARSSELQDGAAEVIAAIRKRGIPVALLTRNSRLSAETVLARHGLAVDCVYTREDGPVKPAPDSVLAICRKFGAAPRDAWVIGDYLFDLQAGNAAGATTVLIIGDGPVPEYAAQAVHVIRSLRELPGLLAGGSSLGCSMDAPGSDDLRAGS